MKHGKWILKSLFLIAAVWAAAPVYAMKERRSSAFRALVAETIKARSVRL